MIPRSDATGVGGTERPPRRDDAGPSGLLLVDKPEGPTSHDMVARVRRAARTRRVGHAGTLDPFATGLLVCGLGRATRLLRYFSGCSKTYRGVIRFGVATDTGDRTGRPLGGAVRADHLDPARLREAAAQLSGMIWQAPPMFSAKKRGGVVLHRLARRGEDVPREPLRVEVGAWDLGSLHDGRLDFEVTCSAGTYVRVLAADLGALVDCPAHLEELRRVRSGDLSVEGALPDASLDDAGVARSLIPLRSVPLPLPGISLQDTDACARFRQGREIPLTGDQVLREGGAVAVRDGGGELLGIGEIDAGGVLRPAVVLAG